LGEDVCVLAHELVADAVIGIIRTRRSGTSGIDGIDEDNQSMSKLKEKMQEGKVSISQILDRIYPSGFGFRRASKHPKINLHTGLIDTTLTFRITPLYPTKIHSSIEHSLKGP
jgi:hypothetical protein